MVQAQSAECKIEEDFFFIFCSKIEMFFFVHGLEENETIEGVPLTSETQTPEHSVQFFLR